MINNLAFKRLLLLFILFLILLSSCNYEVYYNGRFESVVNHTIIDSKFRVDSIVFLYSLDTIPQGSEFIKDVDLHSPLFWGEASFHSPFYMMLNLAKYEAEKCNGNIIQIMDVQGTKSSRLRFSFKFYKLNEPLFSKYDNFLNPINSTPLDTKVKKVHIKNFTQNIDYRIYSNDSIVCTNEDFVRDSNVVDLFLNEGDTIYLILSNSLFVNQKDAFSYTKEEIALEKKYGTVLNNANEFYFFVIDKDKSYDLMNVQRFEYIFNALNY